MVQIGAVDQKELCSFLFQLGEKIRNNRATDSEVNSVREFYVRENGGLGDSDSDILDLLMLGAWTKSYLLKSMGQSISDDQ
jgi:hypothetical protein